MRRDLAHGSWERVEQAEAIVRDGLPVVPQSACRPCGAAPARRPGDRDTLVALATMSRDRGDRAAAVAWARKLVELAPQDPGAQGSLRELDQ